MFPILRIDSQKVISNMDDQKISEQLTVWQRVVQQQLDIVENLIQNMSNVTNEQIAKANQVSHKVRSRTEHARAATSGSHDNIAVGHQLKDATMLLQHSLYGQ